MDTKFPVLFVIAIAVAAGMWGASGITDHLTHDPADDIRSSGDVEQQANESAVHSDQPIEGPVDGGGSDNIAGLIVGGAGSVIGVFALAVLLPFELVNLGFPAWFALPMGFAVQILAGVGIAQFITGRVFR